MSSVFQRRRQKLLALKAMRGVSAVHPHTNEVFSHCGGADLPLALVLWALGRPVPGDILRVKPGVRAWKDIQIQVEKSL